MYFKVEPIKWKILTHDYNRTGKALLLAERVLTANIPYYNYIKHTNTRLHNIYPNNYEYSQIRAWLNGLPFIDDYMNEINTYVDKGFLQTAFNIADQELISVTEVINDGEYSLDFDHTIEYMANGYKSDGRTKSNYPDYTCQNTFDKIFLLSQYELTIPEFGFSRNRNNGESRIRTVTDYAIANHAYVYPQNNFLFGWWWMRTPFYSLAYMASDVYYTGEAFSQKQSNTNYLYISIVPALVVDLPGRTD